MTRKDYIKFANLLASWKLKGYVNQEGVFFNIISDLNTLFKEDNVRFQSNKFINYIVDKIINRNIHNLLGLKAEYM